ncbi:MAG: histidine kinase [Burkholderiales bacterium]|nr:histidine kinase [Burkholderiales bacterium]
MAEAPGASESTFSPSAFDARMTEDRPMRWLGWRLRLLVGAALVGCVALFALMRWMAESQNIDAVFAPGAHDEAVLVSSRLPALAPFAGRALVGLRAADGAEVALDALVLGPSARWRIDDARRERQVRQQEALARAIAGGSVTLRFADGSTVAVATAARGYAGIGVPFWPLAMLALVLYLTGVVVALARVQVRNLLYLLMTSCQAGSLVFIAIDTAAGLGMPPGAAALEPTARLVFDVVTAVAALHAFALHPRRVPGARLIGCVAWGLAALALWALLHGVLPHVWWLTQAALLGYGAAALAALTWSYRIEPNPFANTARRYGAAVLGSLLLVTAAVALSAGRVAISYPISAVGVVGWYLFFDSLLLLVPFLARSKQLLREFAMLAGVSAIATSLDLLFVAAFSLGQFTSLALAVFMGLGAYAGARQWVLNQMVGNSVLTIERTFEHLYRVAREVQSHPGRYAPLVEQLLRELFEPLEVLRVARRVPQACVVGNGSALLVPVRGGSSDEAAARPMALALRYAGRGKRMFNGDDARLANRLVHQLLRAVAYDHAVERGRTEERQRIAQDLHDDIGARLLTLMYKAQSPEMEDYVRHTLLDLKTLTRGLASAEHRLSHAAAEWKADLSQRLNEAQVELAWSLEFDRDLTLSVVQWSALTRVLRELASNALYHARATRVEVRLRLAGSELTLAVADDGCGRAPQSWAHGLGLGGVRKRIKLLGGEVRWRENEPRGIVCEVHIEAFAPAP